MRAINYFIAAIIFVGVLLLDIRIDLTGSPIYLLYAHKFLGLLSLQDVMSALSAPFITINNTVISIRMVIFGAILLTVAHYGFRESIDAAPRVAMMFAFFVAFLLVIGKIAFWSYSVAGFGGVLLVSVLIFMLVRWLL